MDTLADPVGRWRFRPGRPAIPRSAHGRQGRAHDAGDRIFECTGDFISAVLRIMPHASDQERFKRISGQMEEVRISTLTGFRAGKAKPIDDLEFPTVGPRITDHRSLATPPGLRWLHPLLLLTCGAGLALLLGCANRQSQMGVENTWRGDPAPAFDIGATTQSEVMEALGPPSQVISLGERTLFYYLREQQKLQGLSLIIYSGKGDHLFVDV